MNRRIFVKSIGLTSLGLMVGPVFGKKEELKWISFKDKLPKKEQRIIIKHLYGDGAFNSYGITAPHSGINAIIEKHKIISLAGEIDFHCIKFNNSSKSISCWYNNQNGKKAMTSLKSLYNYEIINNNCTVWIREGIPWNGKEKILINANIEWYWLPVNEEYFPTVPEL